MRMTRSPAASRRPQGFRAAGLHCGIKKPAASPIWRWSSRTCRRRAAGLFTTNLAKAAPVLVSQRHLERSRRTRPRHRHQQRLRQRLHGPAGHGRRRGRWRRSTAAAAGVPVEQVLVASTGVIGVEPDDGGDPHRASRRPPRRSRATAAPTRPARIMTTDPFPKDAARARWRPTCGTFRVGGMAKGSGMIEPRMATMLGFLTTDAAVDPALLHRALADACRYTFNAITVDGECSTNDCVFALANGASGVVDRRRPLPGALRGLPRRSRTSSRSASSAAARAPPSSSRSPSPAPRPRPTPGWPRARSPTRRS